MILRAILLTLTIVLADPAAWADHTPAHAKNPVGAVFGDAAAPAKDPFPREALDSSPKTGCPALLDQRLEDLRGRSIDLCAFKGWVLLLVNTASFCGYTPQYKGLQALHERYQARGFAVLGFPSNDFGEQEPGSNQDIASFCEANYGVTFPLFSRVTVLGERKIPLFRTLITRTGPDTQPGEIRWNFEKFLIGRDGTLLARFPSAVEPESPALLDSLARALGG